MNIIFGIPNGKLSMANHYNLSTLWQRQLEYGWSDEDLARRAVLGPATVWRARNPARTIHQPTVQTVRKLAGALGVDLADLVVPDPQEAVA